ncbi:Glycosyl transferase, family 20 [Artemisia annua]|uniref:Glycosyl transferase, family 20 n=1 Tax=Artemisia annua TaxID=35608 RepID=A0A2U1KQ43_ARTAN|nr:Glycosyl transferase, family 20 [Artemisia annua]
MDTTDIEFGRLQAKDMLQHLSTGPISNASVEVVQGDRSVEVRANGVTKVDLTKPCGKETNCAKFGTRSKNVSDTFGMDMVNGKNT